MARHHRTHLKSAPHYAEIQKRLGDGLKQQYEPPKELPHQLFALLLQIQDQDKDQEEAD